MDMFNPPHPGETLREDVLPALWTCSILPTLGKPCVRMFFQPWASALPRRRVSLECPGWPCLASSTAKQPFPLIWPGALRSGSAARSEALGQKRGYMSRCSTIFGEPASKGSPGTFALRCRRYRHKQKRRTLGFAFFVSGNENAAGLFSTVSLRTGSSTARR